MYNREPARTAQRATSVMALYKTALSAQLVSRTQHPVNQATTVLMEPSTPTSLAVQMVPTVTNLFWSQPVIVLPALEGSSVDRKDYQHPQETAMVDMSAYREPPLPHPQMALLARYVMLGPTVRWGLIAPRYVLQGHSAQHKVMYM